MNRGGISNGIVLELSRREGERGRGQISPLSQVLTSLSQLAHRGASQWSYSLEKAHR